MDRDYWFKQTSEAPLFPDLQWSRPENRAHAGKLLIVGGNAQGFAAPAEAFGLANKAGIGTARVLLPDALQKSVGRVFEAGEYAPSTPSGSFAQTALGELLPMAHWADGVLLAGDIGRNSETAILMEKFLTKHQGQVTLTKDAIEYVSSQPGLIQNRANTVLVLSFGQLQKVATGLKFTTAFTSDMGLLPAVDALHELTSTYPIAVITRYGDNILIAATGQVSSTPCKVDDRIWRLKKAASASVWWLQNPSKTFEALTTSVL
ncbi:MAG TPA: hypothetical protein VGE30_03835 [Candidatus Saccharimonadales bacterium]